MRRAQRARQPPPCLKSNNSTDPAPVPALHRLTGGHMRTAFALEENVKLLAEKFGIKRLGFLTLSFADLVRSIREAQRRFNGLRTHVLKDRYTASIAVVERGAKVRTAAFSPARGLSRRHQDRVRFQGVCQERLSVRQIHPKFRS